MDSHNFFNPHKGFSLRELSKLLNVELVNGDFSDRVVRSISPVYRAREGDICYVLSRRYKHELETCNASALICDAAIEPLVPKHIAVLRTKTPHSAFAEVGGLLYPQALQPVRVQSSGISPKASIDPSARIEAGVSIEAFAVIGANVEIGEGTYIGANTVVGPNVKIGRNCSISSSVSIFCSFIGNGVLIHPGVRIGQDGFGYAPGPAGMIKMVQIGRVIIQDNVEIGSNTTIDRGAMDDTVIGEGTKIDNLVQLAHNVHIGRHSALASGVGVAGSTKIGNGVQIGGASGINGHISIGDGAQIAAMSGVVAPVPEGARYGGVPARPMQDFLRECAEIMIRAERRLKNNKKGDDHG